MRPCRALRPLWLLFFQPWYEVIGNDTPGDKKEVLVKELVLDSAVVDIVYLGKRHECLLLTTKKQRLYSSCDSGQSWHEITNQVDPTPSAHIRAEKIIVNAADKSVAVLQVQRQVDDRSAGIIDPAAKSLNSWHPYIFITEDSGRSWRKAWGRHHGLHSWVAHPSRRSWALVSWWNGACNKAEKAEGTESKEESDDPDREKPCMHRLMLTTDLGKTFLQIAQYVVQFSWGSAKINQSDRIYYTAYASKSSDQGKLSQWSTEVDFRAVDVNDQGRPASQITSLKHGNKFMISNEFILVAKVSSEERQTVNLMVSNDGANTWKAALLPSGMGELEEKWYTIVDTSEGAVLLHLNSETGATDTGRIFVSDSEGYKYSQSLLHNVRSSTGEVEFDKVVSLTGVYLANVVAQADSADAGYEKAKQAATESVEQDASEGSSVDRRHGRGWGKASRMAKEERTIRTVISFDKGGSWRYLKPPRVNSQGQPYFCAGKPLQDCALHLHGSSSWDLYAPFYSSENCVGIIMGTGNVGASMRFEPEETSTFFSRDGGLTWVEAHKGAFIYEFGDHGGLIVMADDLKKTGEVIFTWNEGESWYDFKVTNTPFEVDNIITEPNLTSTTFVMFGTREDGSGVVYYLKFDSLEFPACKGSSFADSVSSDYETWTASDGRGEGLCMLGQQITYTRRKRTSQCWNGEAFERPTVKKTCACTEADFACDVGFVRQVGSTECVFGGADMMPERFAPAVCQGTYGATAYRKVPGNQCKGGWTPHLIEVPCPSASAWRSFLKLGLFVLFIMGACHFGRNFQGSGKKSSFEFRAPDTRLSLSSFASSLLMLAAGLCGCLGRLMANRSHEYEKLKGEDFDLDGVRESLNDFLDEDDEDGHHPAPYNSAALDKKQEEARVVAGAAASAARDQAVPRLAPPGGAVHMASTDEDLL